MKSRVSDYLQSLQRVVDITSATASDEVIPIPKDQTKADIDNCLNLINILGAIDKSIITNNEVF